MDFKQIIPHLHAVTRQFPVEYGHLLPLHPINHVRGVSLIKCFCRDCVPMLWECLAYHPEVPKLPVQARCYDVMTLAKVMVAVTSKLKHTLVDPSGQFRVTLDRIETSMREFEDELKKGFYTRHISDLPTLGELAGAFSWLFFRDMVHGVRYSWLGPVVGLDEGQPAKRRIMPPGVRAFATCDGKDIYISTHHFADKECFGHFTPRQLALQIAGAILHEQIHQYFNRNLCDGYCAGTQSQSQLCRFLNGEMYWLYDACTYKSVTLNYRSHCGHGPAFQEVARAIGNCAAAVFGLQGPLELGYYKCRCGLEHPECPSHCMPNRYELMRTVAHDLESEIKEVDAQGGKVVHCSSKALTALKPLTGTSGKDKVMHPTSF
ncbi:hypothetical protein BU24DRAFT_473425 [Aaosphaeria arxii CBS 175.79]|uniref:Uncharacterized protein n=1 Tax=Aaosphaeria arxii CBS 175.79 TaxID=1450172 RepID=A0A6A5XBA9_9PLEO|nr:uncharacterized protein BU24DRAFT_473425 [Aaosphaeria arxii CBS 175.79]KAF2010252.1 hypothetical protein BU24DRAFT_473425 [Aaosphaeria arxii CBS 175.79]